MKKFRIYAEVLLDCSREIEAEDLEDAEEIANGMNGNEWADYARSDSVDITEIVSVIENKPKRCLKAAKPTLSKAKKARGKGNK